MQADGILSDAQATMLRESLDWGSRSQQGEIPRPQRRSRGNWSRWILVLIIAAVLIGFFMLINGSGVQPPTPQDVAATLNDPGGIGQMNRNFSGLLAVALLLVVPLLMWMWLHNSLVAKEETVFEAWAQTESNLKRRADLIPALVETVSRYVRHESETLTSVTSQRSEASLAAALDELIAAQQESAEIAAGGGDAIVDNATDLAALFAAQQRIGQRMSSFLAVAESYPELRSADQFLELQAQLEGTENRINVARMRFNESVAAYNAAIRKLPASLVASAGNFTRKAYFQADQEANEKPELAFD